MLINNVLIKEKAKELETYPGYLPAEVRSYVNTEKYYNSLKEKGLFEEVRAKEYEVRMLLHKENFNRFNYHIYELKKWISENPQYSDFIIE